MGRDCRTSRALLDEEVLAASRSLHPAIEIRNSRYEDFVTAVHAAHRRQCLRHLVVLGSPARANWRRSTCRSKGLGRNEGKFERERQASELDLGHAHMIGAERRRRAIRQHAFGKETSGHRAVHADMAWPALLVAAIFQPKTGFALRLSILAWIA